MSKIGSRRCTTAGAFAAPASRSTPRRRAELFYQQLDGLIVLRNTVRGELLAESRKHQAVRILRQVPSIGPIRAALLLALMQTPHRFRSKRQLWTYSGLAVVTHDSAQHRYIDGQLQRSKKPQQIRGLNQNHNHAMKEIFKSAALNASRCADRCRTLTRDCWPRA